MSAEKILGDWKKGIFKPVYWLFGEEGFYIDQLMQYAEHKILPESEVSFNLTVFYGKDAIWSDIINACRRYPMFAERQVVLLKEAQLMKDLDQLEAYLDNPLPSTVLIIGYKGKGYDKRTKFHKTLIRHADLFESQKIKEENIVPWIHECAQSMGLEIDYKSSSLLQEHLGSDLSRIKSELEKISLNLEGKRNIDDTDIEKYVGISREFNVNELQQAIARRDLPAAVNILNYFASNPKAFAIQMVIPMLYFYFSKVYVAYGTGNRNEKTLKPLFFFNAGLTDQALQTMRNYQWQEIERLILLLNQYNLKSIGVGDSGSSGAELMKEMVVKIMMK